MASKRRNMFHENKKQETTEIDMNVSGPCALDDNNCTAGDGELPVGTGQDDIIYDNVVQALFCLLYTTIFVLGLFGNVLVCYVVGRNKAMHTVTNCFITNLALSDILLCVLAVPFTPLYSFLGRWIFGPVMCHLVTYAQGTSVYISTLTLTSIAVDRFFVIIHPFRPRMKLSTCLCIIICIWMISMLLTMPYGLYMDHKYFKDRYYCEETWPSESLRQAYGGMTATLQFVIPFFVIVFCYVKVSLKLNDRARSKPGAKTCRKEEADRERKRRTNRMLIAMVTIFGVSWLPLNLINFLNDVYIPTSGWRFYYLTFFTTHAIAMSSTCYNPFLYAWLNDNFRKEFKQVLPCISRGGSSLLNVTCGGGGSGDSKRKTNSSGSAGGRSAMGRTFSSRRNCNGQQETTTTCQETTLIISTSNSIVVQNNNQSPTTTSTLNNQSNDEDNFNRSKLKPHDSVEVVLVAYTVGEDGVHIDTIATDDEEHPDGQKQMPSVL